MTRYLSGKIQKSSLGSRTSLRFGFPKLLKMADLCKHYTKQGTGPPGGPWTPFNCPIFTSGVNAVQNHSAFSAKTINVTTELVSASSNLCLSFLETSVSLRITIRA